MSINKIDDLNFEREFPSYGDWNDSNDIEFTKEGIEIDYDVLDWEIIKKAYRILFNHDIQEAP
jgi:hypothetical protein